MLFVLIHYHPYLFYILFISPIPSIIFLNIFSIGFIDVFDFAKSCWHFSRLRRPRSVEFLPMAQTKHGAPHSVGVLPVRHSLGDGVACGFRRRPAASFLSSRPQLECKRLRAPRRCRNPQATTPALHQGRFLNREKAPKAFRNLKPMKTRTSNQFFDNFVRFYDTLSQCGPVPALR